MDLPDGIELVTPNSPIGRAILKKRSEDIVEVVMPDNSVVKYIIFYVDEEPKK